MDTTIRNLDERAYRALRARAALDGRTVGDVLSEAIRAYLARSDSGPRTGTLRNLKPERFPKGSEKLSQQVDSIVYGRKR